jgi:DNA-binding SARP family transcriptional activator
VPDWNPEALSLLPGWYDDWVIVERERLRQRLLHALEAVCYRLSEAGRHAELVEAALRVVELDPLRESGQRALISAHLAEGNVIEAWRTYAACRQVLKTELGLAPSIELTRLVEARCDPARDDVSTSRARPIDAGAPTTSRLCSACPLLHGQTISRGSRTR